MKALYVLWPNFEYIDRLVDAGIDTLLVTCHDMPFETSSGYYDKKETVVNTINRYRGKVKLFLVPLWIRPWVEIPIEQQWVTEEGYRLEKTPCPLNTMYIRYKLSPVIAFAFAQKMDGIIWDLEHLEHQTNADVLPFYNHMHPEDRCHCAICQRYKLEDLWKAHAGIIHDLLNQSGIPIHGQMPYTGGWTMRQYPGDLHHFTEETYMGDVSFCDRLKWKYSWKRAGVSPKLIPGIWVEWFNDEDMIQYIKHLYHKYDGFWLYSHEYFGNHIPNPHVGYPNKGRAGDWFFEELRKI